MTRLVTVVVISATSGVLALALGGCSQSESACEKAAGSGGTHACYLEIHREERETKEAEYGSLRAAHEA
jgi:hypothetical protein